MFLSYFKLDIRNPQVRQCLYDANDMHRTILSCFKDIKSETPRKDLGILYRLEAQNKEIKLYILSIDRPDLEKFFKTGFYTQAESKNILDVVNNLKNDAIYSFDLFACSSKKKIRKEKNSQRVFLSNEEDRYEWLKRKGLQNGFELKWVREEGQEKIYTNTNKQPKEGVRVGVRFKGELKVLDEELFKRAFVNGIGPGKSYGLGMLLLFPQGKFTYA